MDKSPHRTPSNKELEERLIDEAKKRLKDNNAYLTLMFSTTVSEELRLPMVLFDDVIDTIVWTRSTNTYRVHYSVYAGGQPHRRETPSFPLPA